MAHIRLLVNRRLGTIRVASGPYDLELLIADVPPGKTKAELVDGAVQHAIEQYKADGCTVEIRYVNEG